MNAATSANITAFKLVCQVAILMGCLNFTPLIHAQSLHLLGQTLQINTHLHYLAGNPEWLLIIRDANSQRVFPYLYDFDEKENYWLAFTYSHSYIITESRLTWDRFTVIENFCHLENGIFNGQSMYILLNGDLTPDLNGFACSVQTYMDDMPIPIVKSETAGQP